MSQNNILSMSEPRSRSVGVLATSDESRKIAEIKAQLTIAKASPRDFIRAEQDILENCHRKSFAEVSTYQYPRGGQTIMGPSIRMAEMLAQNWGNMEFGFRVIERREGESTVEAFAWDLQTNVKRTVQFQVAHVRDTRQGPKQLKEVRDISEMESNQAARRIRGCILNVIPGDVVEKALDQCRKTLSGGSTEPLIDRVKKMVSAFAGLGVTKDMITDRLRHGLEAATEEQLHELRGIFTGIKDGASSREDWFTVQSKPTAKQEPEDGDDTDLAPTPKAKRRRTPKPKHDDMAREEMVDQLIPEVSQALDILSDHIEAATKYAQERKWIEKDQGLKDLKKSHAIGIIQNSEAIINIITKGAK